MKDDVFALWVYLARSPLLWLTVTILVDAHGQPIRRREVTQVRVEGSAGKEDRTIDVTLERRSLH